MRYAIVESGGKQYKAVEGETIEVDRLPVNAGEKVGLERVLMLVDGEDVTVGMPTVDGIQVNTTVMDHYKGPKILIFKYSPKKRIRVKTGHRQQYTRLMVDVIGKPGESRKAAKAEKAEAPVEAKTEKKAEAKAEKKVEKKESTEKKPAVKEKKAPAKKTEKAPAKTTTKKKTTEKSSSTKTAKK